MIDIKTAVANDNEVEFQYYRDGSLWYKEIGGSIFPVPIEDIGNATFKRTDRAMLFMRYMRKYNKTLGVTLSNGG